MSAVRDSVIRVTGTFDRDAAERLRHALSTTWAADPGAVLVDFSLAREVSDVGLALVAAPLLGGNLRVRFRGLTQRQRRLLRFLSPGPEREPGPGGGERPPPPARDAGAPFDHAPRALSG
jgi:hypothetical protein